MPASLPDPKFVRAPIAGRKSRSGKLTALSERITRYSDRGDRRRSPRDSGTASSARSRLPFSRSRPVNQLPSLTPSSLTPLTRRIPAAKVGSDGPGYGVDRA